MATPMEAQTPDPVNAEASVLLVDDDREILQLVARFLRANGFRVLTARNGAEMKATLQAAGADLVVLDIMLPGASGLQLCQDIRRESRVPIIMLTAKGDEIDRIVGLEMGADDYLAKPFNPRELLARVRAVLRRAATPQMAARGRRVLFGGWSLDTMTRELTGPDGALVDLSGGEYDLLLTFLEAPQRVLTRDYLLDAARNRVSDGFDRSIDVQVSRLRKKVDPAGTLIRTIRGVGYLFAVDVARR